MRFEIPGAHCLIHQVFDFPLIESLFIRLNLNDDAFPVDKLT